MVKSAVFRIAVTLLGLVLLSKDNGDELLFTSKRESSPLKATQW